MKYIDKQIQNEPAFFKLYRTKTPNAKYGGYSDKHLYSHPLRDALLKEQGHLCAYCMGRISLDLNKNYKPKIGVEHFKSQELYPHLDLNYNNLLGVCNGLSVSYPEKEKMHHCDKTKGPEGKINGKVALKKLNPCDVNCESLVTYIADGKITATKEDRDVLHDIENVLNLNNKALIDARKVVLDNARNKMIKEKPTQQWNKAFLQKHLEEWQAKEKGQFRRYCMIAVWFIKTLLSKPRYNR